jgi:hypothetical protein
MFINMAKHTTIRAIQRRRSEMNEVREAGMACSSVRRGTGAGERDYGVTYY